ncbi:hypothetical protein THAOC_36087, partial [Thalassiosira oceanica]
KKIRGLRDDGFCNRVSGHIGYFVATEGQDRIVLEFYFTAAFVARYGLETVSAPIQDWSYLHEQSIDEGLDEEDLDRAIADFKAAQEEDVNGMVEEVPPSPYATPGGSTPAGATPRGEVNWMKGKVREISLRLRELGSTVADAQATANSAVSTVTSALNASNAASSTASNALTLAKAASDKASSLAGRVQTVATEGAQTGHEALQTQGGGTPAGWSAPAAQQQPGAITPADVDALRQELMRAIERALVASQSDAYEPLPGEVVAVFDDALKLAVAHFPNDIAVDLISPGYWETFDTPSQTSVSAASVAKDLKTQQGLGANKGTLIKIASANQRWPQDLSSEKPKEKKFFSKVGTWGEMMTGNQSVYHQAVAKRNDDVKDLHELRNERLSLHPQAVTLLRKFDETTGQVLTWNQGQLQTLRDEIIMKQ